jgi:hypothetical protein
MRRSRIGNIFILGMLFTLWTGLFGCSSSSDPVITPIPKAEQDLCSIAQAYREAFTQTRKAPESFDDIRKYLISLGGNPDEMQVSPNDGQPYVVLWGCDPTKGGTGPVRGMWAVIAHEQSGKDGKRAIADMRGLATTVTDQEFSQLKFIPKKKSSAKSKG